MIFRRKKPENNSGSRSVLRGRDNADDGARPGSGPGGNPLARRFQPEGEPDTIDLEDPARFHAFSDASEDEPTTDIVGEAPDSTGKSRDQSTDGREKIVTQDPATGKFYLHPGAAEVTVYLGDEPVTAPTELRSGDKIRIGDAEFHFRAGINRPGP